MSIELSNRAANRRSRDTTKQAPKDFTGIRKGDGRYQVRVYGGMDPVTGKPVMLAGSAATEDAAIELRARYRQQVKEHTAARTAVTVGYLLDRLPDAQPRPAVVAPPLGVARSSAGHRHRTVNVRDGIPHMPDHPGEQQFLQHLSGEMEGTR